MKKILMPYIELARLNKPAGFMLLFWPCCFGVILASDEVLSNYYFFILFFIGAIALRSAGCIVNDIVDRNIDAQVERTKNRPLASGALKLHNAYALLFFMLSVGFWVFMQLNDMAKLYSLGAALLAIIYPFMKRIFNYPQVFLGLAFSSGAVISWVEVKNYVSLTPAMIYLGCVFWTIGYDTIYGHMDKNDDRKIGIKSTAIKFGKLNRVIIWTCFAGAYFCISYAGIMFAGNLVHFFLIPAAVQLLYITKKVDLDSPQDCLKRFNQIAFMNGFLIASGLYLGKLIIL